jgi:hypothetical protein
LFYLLYKIKHQSVKLAENIPPGTDPSQFYHAPDCICRIIYHLREIVECFDNAHRSLTEYSDFTCNNLAWYIYVNRRLAEVYQLVGSGTQRLSREQQNLNF